MKDVVYFFGGSFDPWHNGHSAIVDKILALPNSKLLIAPAYNPWKGKGLLNLDERISLIEKIYNENERVEVLKEGFTYTVDFIEKYSLNYDIILVMGEDSFETFSSWKNYDRIKSLIKGEFIVSRCELSSTKIRNDLKKSYGLVPQVVYDYLLLNKINYKKPSLTADSIVVNDEGKILLMKRNTHPFKGSWVFPGGFIDEGENPLEAALRELEEETGIKASKEETTYNDVFYKKDRDPRDWIITMSYVVKLSKNQEARIIINNDGEEEAAGFSWVSKEELEGLEMGFDHSLAFQRAKEQKIL